MPLFPPRTPLAPRFARPRPWSRPTPQLPTPPPPLTRARALSRRQVFTIQFVREFARLGLTRSVGGVLSLAFARELTPVIGSVIMVRR